MRYHAKNNITAAGVRWVYEAKTIPLAPTAMLLVRIMIGKVANKKKLVEILESIPVPQDDKQFNCVIWVQNALRALEADGKALGTCVLDWGSLRDQAMEYCQKKMDQGRFTSGSATADNRKAPTYDLLTGQEVIP